MASASKHSVSLDGLSWPSYHLHCGYHHPHPPPPPPPPPPPHHHHHAQTDVGYDSMTASDKIVDPSTDSISPTSLIWRLRWCADTESTADKSSSGASAWPRSAFPMAS
eukprot:2346180-Rhodomonas_salina.1